MPRRAESVAAALLPEPQAQPASQAASTPKLPAKDAHGELNVLVLDDLSGSPVARAKIQLTSLRRGDEPGAAYLWPGPMPSAETDMRGEARMPFPAWVHGLSLTGAVDISVSHPEYATLRDSNLKVESLAHKTTLRLKRGAFLVVSGWIGSPTKVIRDVKPKVEDDAQHSADDWLPVRDGRPSTGRLKPGPHALVLSWTSPEGAAYASRVESFTLASGEQREIALELLKCTPLRVVLDPQVPRPIENGKVEVSVAFGERGGPTSLRTWQMPPDAQGVYIFPALPPGRAQIIARCDGWVSDMVASGVSASAEGNADQTVETLCLPTFDTTATAEFIVPMRRTASVELTFVDPSGSPVQHALVLFSPNVHWANGYATLFLDDFHEGTSDERGLLKLEHLPPALGERFSFQHASFQLAPEHSNDGEDAAVDLVSGESTKATFQLVPKVK